MEFAEQLQQLIKKSGYVLVDQKAMDDYVRLNKKRPFSSKQLSGLINAMYQTGCIRLQCTSPKDDEAFRLFGEDSP